MTKSKSKSKTSFDSKTMAVIAHKGYTVEKQIGQGAYGTVFKAKNKKGQLSAVKVIEMSSLSKNTKEKYLPREIKTLIECRHENLIAVFDIFRASQKMFIFMEFAGNGDITGYAKKNKGIKEDLACKWFHQAASGLDYLHVQMKTAHRDIKLDNILLDANWIAKMTDFGFAKHCYDEKQKCVILSSTFCGTVPYECPQILGHKKYDAFKADTWSMGISLFVMLHDRFPFHYKDRKEMLTEIMDYPKFLRTRYVKKLPSDANSLVEQLLNPNEDERADVQVIIRSSYLRSRLTK